MKKIHLQVQDVSSQQEVSFTTDEGAVIGSTILFDLENMDEGKRELFNSSNLLMIDDTVLNEIRPFNSLWDYIKKTTLIRVDPGDNRFFLVDGSLTHLYEDNLGREIGFESYANRGHIRQFKSYIYSLQNDDFKCFYAREGRIAVDIAGEIFAPAQFVRVLETFIFESDEFETELDDFSSRFSDNLYLKSMLTELRTIVGGSNDKATPVLFYYTFSGYERILEDLKRRFKDLQLEDTFSSLATMSENVLTDYLQIFAHGDYNGFKFDGSQDASLSAFINRLGLSYIKTLVILYCQSFRDEADLKMELSLKKTHIDNVLFSKKTMVEGWAILYLHGYLRSRKHTARFEESDKIGKLVNYTFSTLLEERTGTYRRNNTGSSV